MNAGNDVRLTILVDNRVRPDPEGLRAEHGLSLWIEQGGRRILFDTGQGTALEQNASLLGVDLSTADFLVLSHGHYDHTGGVAPVLRRTRRVHLYCHPAGVQPRYALRDGKTVPIHMPPFSRAALDGLSSERMHWHTRAVMPFESVGLTGPIPRKTGYEDTGGPFSLDPEGRRPDPIEDDCALWIRTGQGVVVCLGCAHAGVINTLHYLRELEGEGLNVRAVIGGFHLLNAHRERLDRTVEALREINPGLVVPCHCTGDEATAILREGLGERVVPGAAGKRFSF